MDERHMKSLGRASVCSVAFGSWNIVAENKMAGHRYQAALSVVVRDNNQVEPLL